VNRIPIQTYSLKQEDKTIQHIN